MTTRAPLPSHPDQPMNGAAEVEKRFQSLEDRAKDLESRADHQDYVEGKIASFDEHLQRFDKRLDGWEADRAEQREQDRKAREERSALDQQRFDALNEKNALFDQKLDKVIEHSKQSAEASGNSADLLKSARDLSAVLPPSVRSYVLVGVLIVGFLVALVNALQTIGVVHK